MKMTVNAVLVMTRQAPGSVPSLDSGALALMLLASLFIAVVAGFVWWLRSRDPSEAILGGGAAFLAVLTVVFAGWGALSG